MMKLFTTAALLASVALPAAAADMANKAAPYKEPSPVKCTWCGFSITVDGAYGWADAKTDLNLAPIGLSDPSMKGWGVGATARYLWTPGNGPLAFGLGLDYLWANNIKDDQTVSVGTAPVLALHTKFEHMAAARAYAGFALGPQLLLYGNAGLAFAKSTATVDLNLGKGLTPIAESRENLYGYVLGAGLDWKVTENILLGVSYSYFNFGDHPYEFAAVGGGPVFGSVKAETTANIFKVHGGIRF